MACLPEKTGIFPWILPLTLQRVSSEQKGHELEFEQLDHLLNQPETPFSQALCCLVTDSLYPVISNREMASRHDRLVWTFRARANRKFYAPAPVGETRKKYGPKMKLNAPETHLPPQEQGDFLKTTSNDQKQFVKYKRWNHLLLRGSRKFKGYLHPVDLVQYEVFDLNGVALFQRPLWLAVSGKRRSEISSQRAYQSYGQRYDLAHFFRFGKNHLLMDQFQTPEVKHEESWWQIVLLA